MTNNLYIGTDVAIADLSLENYNSVAQLVSSGGYRAFMEGYFKDLAIREINMYSWLTNSRRLEELLNDVILLTKQLLVMEPDEIYGNNLNSLNVAKALFITEDAYNYWRRKQRFLIYRDYNNVINHISFMEMESMHSRLIMQLYRTCEEKLQGKENHVYRQVQAGANASFILKNYKWNNSAYPVLKPIPFIDTVVLRTPILFHPYLSGFECHYSFAEENPVKTLKIISSDWGCYPLKVGGLLCFTYFHKDFTGNAAALANLFELAKQNEIENSSPDLICIFGKQDDGDGGTIYYDKDTETWITTVSYDQKIKHFSYMKNAILLLHNLAKIKNNSLPIHGSMVEISFFDGTKKSLVIIGDSGTGKSETIEAIRRLNNTDATEKRITEIKTVFDDMGSFSIVNGKVIACGTETGAFIRLNGLDETNSYHDMERSIFLNPENKDARVILPVSTYESVNSKHQVDIVLYANNYEDKIGVEPLENLECIQRVFWQANYKKTADGPICSSFFANSYGPLQMKEKCLPLLNDVFQCLYDNNVYVGQVYTNLSTGYQSNINKTAECLIELLQKV